MVMASMLALSVASLPKCMESDKFSDSSLRGKNKESGYLRFLERRKVVLSSVGILSWTLLNNAKDGSSVATEFADMPALRGKNYGKTKMRYPDYTETESGLQYKDLRVGDGPNPKAGDTVVVDWDGYTIGYYGRIFEARNKTKGGSFEGDNKDFFKFKIGSQEDNCAPRIGIS
ncbi:peptidyl-prolyl cis-trans isomerase FKBP19, chloroplastic-like isoform X2 [Neltuma alba]|uniref:peptidyl-prolyl cis-trans isomerase FKBP19, chloroplastic-like isoform X2 n=1 Tax=Neltuma alba TaxID=207710 RepID=UPI0010A4A466|nr:peptidyl-prolyl cis-trans isomerase FKBP19, chloroplastic-like isoform X2 [Prosopis alba]XP_028784209.1 peptidyl-prolyl cis-trans isomerase FKBP19, chloroplastic-like isoform X2 [Prosopis alba]